ncbi:glycosyltransferase [Escherichia coli]|nr:glycosyltransferase [Escherichia coli]
MISVCIPTYNGENYIKQQILSILNELGEDDEIVISDDGSTDMTLAIIEEINDKRIIVIKK